MDKDRMGRARNARINQAVKHATELLEVLRRLSGFPKNEHVDLKDEWWDGRNKLEQLVQCFHEANAYNNACIGDPAVSRPLIRRGEGEPESDPGLPAGSPVRDSDNGETST